MLRIACSGLAVMLLSAEASGQGGYQRPPKQVCDILAAATVPAVWLSAAIGEPVQWVGSDALLVQLIPEKRGEPPVAPAAPAGPVVQESGGKAGPVWTFQDLLRNPHDEALFEYYCTSQPAL